MIKLIIDDNETKRCSVRLNDISYIYCDQQSVVLKVPFSKFKPGNEKNQSLDPSIPLLYCCSFLPCSTVYYSGVFCEFLRPYLVKLHGCRIINQGIYYAKCACLFYISKKRMRKMFNR